MTASPASPALDDFAHPCWRRPFSLTAPLPTLPSTFPTTGERCSGHGPVSRSPLLEAQVPSPEVHSCPSHCFCHFLTYNNPSSLPYLNFFFILPARDLSTCSQHVPSTCHASPLFLSLKDTRTNEIQPRLPLFQHILATLPPDLGLPSPCLTRT